MPMSAEFMRSMARCDLVHKVLARLKDSPSFYTHADKQASCLESNLKFMELNEDEVADAACRLTAIGFPADIERRLLETVTARSIHAPPKHKPRSNSMLQNYEWFLDYLQQGLWEKIQSANKVEGLKLLIGALIDLGLRHARFPT